MTGAWKGGLQFATALDLGTVPATSQVTGVTGASTSYTKGTFQQIVASTTADSTWIMIYISNQISGGSAFAVDIAVGTSGSEVAVISNLLCSADAAQGVRYMFPLTIPAGTRISARVSSNVGFDSLPVGVTVFSDAYASVGSGGPIDTYGFLSTTNYGTTVDPGATANTKGAYTQIVASTTADLAGLSLYIDSQGTSTGAVGPITWLVDVAVGPSGSEVVILPNLFIIGVTGAGFSITYAPVISYLPLQIGAASRIAVRAASSTGTTPDRLLGITVYGVRQ
jgi:hypothetical protein